MKFSLIMATLGRYDEIVTFLDSLSKQTYGNFELFIIDQNGNDRIEKLCSLYSMNIRVIQSAVKGLSVNRNTGLKLVSGDIIAFPDDDCEYESGTLEKIASFFENNPEYDFYTCNTKEKNGEKAAFITKKKDCAISVSNFLSAGISFTIFARAGAVSCFNFDEQLGIGAAFGSAEESDLLLYFIKNKKKGRYHSLNYIFHPCKEENQERVYSYSLGFGALFKKALSVYRMPSMFFIFLYRITRNILKLCLRPKNKTVRSLVSGRITGFLKYKPSL